MDSSLTVNVSSCDLVESEHSPKNSPGSEVKFLLNTSSSSEKTALTEGEQTSTKTIYLTTEMKENNHIITKITTEKNKEEIDEKNETQNENFYESLEHMRVRIASDRSSLSSSNSESNLKILTTPTTNFELKKSSTSSSLSTSETSSQSSDTKAHKIDASKTTENWSDDNLNTLKPSQTNSSLIKKTINNEIINESLRNNTKQSQSPIIMNAAALKSTTKTNTSSNSNSNQIKELSGSSNFSNESQTQDLQQQQSNKMLNSITNPINIKPSQIVEAVSTAANATSEALANFISSTESSKSYSFNNGSVIVSDESLSLKQMQPLASSHTQLNNFKEHQFISQSVQLPSASQMINKKNGKDKNKKPWYSAFTNTYKQKNDDFKKLFKLKSDEHLLVDYSCALQREILAHGRLYISLNYVCFRANIIGWETTLIIKLKDIKQIVKDKTAKIIPNAITIILDNEKYFFTSFAARDKTYTSLFRVWQIALADSAMSPEEIGNILRTSYGEDLGYNSDDVDYEYYNKLKFKSHPPLNNISSSPDQTNFYKNTVTSSTVEFHSLPEDQRHLTNCSTQLFLNTNESNNDTSVSSDEHNMTQSTINNNNSNNTEIAAAKTHGTAKELILRSAAFGHRQSSSYDASLIDTSDANERPRSMVVNKQGLNGSNYPLRPATQNNSNNNPSSKPGSPLHPTPLIPIGSPLYESHNHLSSSSSLDASQDNKLLSINSVNTSNQQQQQRADNNNNNVKRNNYSDVENEERNLNGVNVSDTATTPAQIAASKQQLNSPMPQVNNSDYFSTSSPINNLSPSPHESSSSASMNEQESGDEQGEVKCSCGEHQGKEMLSQVFNLSVNYLWECVFGHTDFCKKYWDSRKFGNMKISEWRSVNSCLVRQLNFTVDLGAAIGKPKNTEDQKILEYKPNQCIVLESDSVTHGVPYSEYFTVKNRFCITRVTSSSSKLTITSFLNYIQKPNFIVKGFIERNCIGALKDSYNYLANLINKEYNSIEKVCHDCVSVAHICTMLKQISIYGDLLKNGNNNNDNNCERNSTRGSSTASSASSSMSSSGSNEKFHSSASLLIINTESLLIDQTIAREKNLAKQPGSSEQSVHISAYTAANNSTTPVRPHIHESATVPANIMLTSNAKETPVINRAANQTIEIKATQSFEASNLNNNNNNGSVKKRHSRSSHSPSCHEASLRIMNEKDDSQNYPANNLSTSNQHVNLKPQLVPIQRFSFFKWQVNVDTLVRLFIIAMICLMVINAMLYYKLRRIESLADGLRSDPSLMTKISNNVYPQKPFENILSESTFYKDLHNWRDVISNTLNVIEKMETSLKEWDKSLENKQILSKTQPTSSPMSVHLDTKTNKETNEL